MIAFAEKTTQTESVDGWQDGFLEMLPQITRHARLAFNNLDEEAQEDAVSEVIANAMCVYQRLHERGELERAFSSALVRFAVAQYKDGRRVGSRQASRDVYSPLAKRKSGYEVLSFRAPGDQVGRWVECLIDRRRTPVPDQAAFRIDFPKWLDGLTPRNCQIARKLSLGYSTGETAREFELTPGRVSQIRRELSESWYKFTEEWENHQN